MQHGPSKIGQNYTQRKIQLKHIFDKIYGLFDYYEVGCTLYNCVAYVQMFRKKISTKV